MYTKEESLEALKDIRKMMSESSRFIGLSGLSGIAAGLCALGGAIVAHYLMSEYWSAPIKREYNALRLDMLYVAIGTLAAALLSAWFFTYRKTSLSGEKLWNSNVQRLLISLLVPLVTGAIVLMKLWLENDDELLAPGCLIFYGLALMNASKYTYKEVNGLGLCETVLGLICLFIPGKGLYFWTFGFGVLHLIYGGLMWNRYEMKRS